MHICVALVQMSECHQYALALARFCDTRSAKELVGTLEFKIPNPQVPVGILELEGLEP